jgi:GntR family transcriptional regulator/MocR family aminotransferase
LTHASFGGGEALLFSMSFARSKTPLYLQLYRRIREGIESGEFAPGEKLPSKRRLAEHLQISQFTVENAYTQLLSEGYIRTAERRGYFVEDAPVAVPRAALDSVPPSLGSGVPAALQDRREPPPPFDLATNAVDTEHFPYSVWSRLVRERIRDDGARILSAIHPQGDLELRTQIARYLREYRGVAARPDQIVVGAGTEYLIGGIAELLPGAVFGYENPGYGQIRRVLAGRGVPAVPIGVDDGGLDVDALGRHSASAVFVTPSNQFPTSAVMSIGRRRQLLEWAANKSGYVIEDDFDSEFRHELKPIPALKSLDSERVIYMNSFGKTLAPSLRIAYLVLPDELLERSRERLSAYSCTVSELEQLTLASFIERGHYERHLAKMKVIYRGRRDVLVSGLAPLGERLEIRGKRSGLHLLLTMPELAETKMVERARAQGVGVYPLTSKYESTPPETHTVLVGYAGMGEADLAEAARRLCAAWG